MDPGSGVKSSPSGAIAWNCHRCEHAPQQWLPADELATIIRVLFNTFLLVTTKFNRGDGNIWLTALDG
jgi:hypothetical protein